VSRRAKGRSRRERHDNIWGRSQKSQEGWLSVLGEQEVNLGEGKTDSTFSRREGQRRWWLTEKFC
jgi:hypothetical protein